MTTSKVASHQLKYSRAVISSGRSNLDLLIESLQAKLGPKFTEQRGNEVRSLITCYCNLLEDATRGYDDMSTVLTVERTEDVMARDTRDQVFGHLSKMLNASRNRIRENLGDKAIALYGLHKPIPTGYEGRRRYAEGVVLLLQTHPKQVTDLFGHSFTTAMLANGLKTAIADLDGGMKEVAREQRETQTARANRNQAEELFRVTLVNVASILEAHYRMAGLIEQAERVRPTYARTSGDVEFDDDLPPDEEPTDDGQEPDDGHEPDDGQEPTKGEAQARPDVASTNDQRR